MEKLKPKLFSVMKTYTKAQFVKDMIAGIIVAIVALPLSIALAIASGVEPQIGIYTAIVAGFVISFLGGSRVQIAGPTAAFATIVAGIVAENGMDGLIVATIMAGILLVIMGFCRLGSLIRFIPYTITTGFTAGIAVTIVIGQLNSFFGVNISEYTKKHGSPIESVEKMEALISCFSTWNVMALIVGIVSFAIVMLWPKVNKTIPSSLVAVVVAAAVVKLGNLDVATIGSSYENLTGLPKFQIPNISFKMVRALLPDALTIAILAAIESLLSCVVADGMIGSRHRSNMELIAQGAGNIASGLFGGIPATGAIARTAANIKNGGRTPIAGMVHSVVLFLMLLFLMPYAAMIPMPTIAAILFMVAINMSGYRAVGHTLKRAPKSDIAVLLITFFLTVIFDLVVAILVGFVLATLLFMKRMSDVTNIRGWEYVEDYEKVSNENENYDEDTDPDHIRFKSVPKHTTVYEITGPLFFGAADKINDIVSDVKKGETIILRMRSVPAMDETAMHSLENVYRTCKKKKIQLVFSHVNEQPMSVLKKHGFLEMLGEDHFCKNIDEALEYADKLQVSRIEKKEMKNKK